LAVPHGWRSQARNVQKLDSSESKMGYRRTPSFIWRALCSASGGMMTQCVWQWIPRLLLISLAGWLNQHQQDAIDYLQEENRVLREQLRGKRLRFNDDQRRRLAVRAKKLGGRMLQD
jgi:hypothetical protein